MTTSDTAPPARAGRREWLGLAMLALPALLVSMDLTVLHLAVPAISADLQPSGAQQLWIVDIYGFMIAGFLVTMGTVGDRIGRRKLLLVGAGAFGVASMVAAFSASAEMLIAARALLGIAGATLAPSTLALIRTMFPDPRQRSSAIALWFMSFMTGSAVGPLIGGVLLEVAWWGATFLIGVPVMALLLALGPWLLPEHRTSRPGRMDLIGALTALAAILTATYGLKTIAETGVGGVPVAAIAVGLVLGVVFVRRQGRIAEPLIDLGLFRQRVAGVSVLALMIGAIAVGGMGYLTGQFLQLVAGLSPISAGLWMLPPLLTGIVTTLLAPRAASRVGPGVIIAAGLGIAAAGVLLVGLADGGPGSMWIVAGLVALFGGVMPVLALGVDVVVGAAPPDGTGAASAITETAQELGIAVGIAVLGSVVTAVYRQGTSLAIDDAVPADVAEAVRSTLGGASGVIDRLPAGVLDAAERAFTAGLGIAAVISAAMLAITAAVAAVVLRRVPALPEQDPAPGEPSRTTSP